MARNCMICGERVETVLSLGRMPLANGFVRPEDFGSEYYYELAVGLCGECGMVQLIEPVPSEKMFHAEYAYFSSTSQRMAAHFREFAAEIASKYLSGPRPLVVELGSNDGILLKHFVEREMDCLGIEPSANVAAVAVQAGVPTMCAFFDEATALLVRGEYGSADVILAANVLCHIEDLSSTIAAMRTLLKPNGVIVIEDPYLGEIVAKTAYDQIYDEHVYYFSLSSLAAAFARYDFELIGVAPQTVHGGSMRYAFARRGTRRPEDTVVREQTREKQLRLTSLETFAAFRQRVERSREALVSLLTDLAARGRRVVGYGATSKSTTMINYCGLTPSLVEYISDTTAGKQGKFSPGAHIPIRPREDFLARYPDYALLLAWNHREEVLLKESAYTAAGGKWIVYVPEVQIL